MANVKINIGANLIGNAWHTLVSLLFVPFYIKFMGVEAYGLVGIFVTLQIMAGALDMGFGGTMNREMARRSALPDDGPEMRNLVRSMEIIYWNIALLIGVIIVLISPLIAQYWIKGQNLSVQTITQAILIMGLAISLQWPASLYYNGLIGLQKHVLINAVIVCTTTVRGVGAICVLWLISPTIQAFFLWQIFMSSVYTFILAFILWRCLPLGEKKPVFQMRLIRSIGRFAAGIASVTILSIILTQLDKIILSKMLSLESFGYYTLAALVGLTPLRVALPVFSGVYPKFTQLVSLDDPKRLRDLYHKSCQLMAVLILPLTVVFAIFSYELILLWTQNSLIAERTHILASILICGTALHSLLLAPHALQLAFGWTRLLFFKYLVSVIAIIPLIIYMTKFYGAIGAASVWVILNLATVILEIPIMHRRLLTSDKWAWYKQDFFIPLITAVIIAGAGRLLFPPGMPQWMTIIFLITVSGATLAGATIVTPTTRGWLFEQLVKIKFGYGN
jgi:O-antigen/teichoic acid export membrane protein